MVIKSTLLIFILILLIAPCPAQENTACPKIKVSTSASSYVSGDPAPFSVSIIENPNNLKLEYEWQISAGTIDVGQGTASIIIDTTGLENMTVTGTVKIKGLPGNCENVFSADAFIASRLNGNPLDEVRGPQTNNEIKARLDSLYRALIDDPTASAAIVNYGSDKQVAARTARLLRAISARKYDKKRLIFIKGGNEPDIRTKFYIVPKGAEFPKP